MKKRLVILGILAVLSPNIHAKSKKTISGRVSSVVDGDTFKVQTEIGETLLIQLAYIDAPQIEQAFGQKAQEQLDSLIKDKNITAKISQSKKGNYGIVQMEDGRELNQYLVEKGLAWFYHTTDSKYINAQKNAVKGRIGLWSENEPIAPWKYDPSGQNKTRPFGFNSVNVE